MSTQDIYGILILAAGSSSRLGQPKQLLQIGETTLLSKAIQEAANTSASHIMVVVNEKINTAVSETHHATFLINDQATEGISSSIKKGIHALVNSSPEITAAIIMLCDQPYVTTSVLQRLIDLHEQTGKPIIAAAYADTLGTPVLFHRTFFEKLLSLQGDTGAKKILKQYPGDIASIDFPEGFIDIDTPEDLQKLKAFYR